MDMKYKKIPSELLLDFYKLSHREQYPKGTETIYSTWTARSSKFLDNIPFSVHYGLSHFIQKFLIKEWNETFFNRPKQEVINEYKRFIKHTLNPKQIYTKHLEELHDFGYLPIRIKAVKEGSLVPIRVPSVTIENTNKKFFWLTNYLETLFSCENWNASTSATVSTKYRMIVEKYAKQTSDDFDFVKWQCHDFSMRGMSSAESSQVSGSAHLLNFYGTDSVPSILFLENYYKANIEKELVGSSIPATEHSVSSCVCGDGKNHIEDETKLLTELMTKVYPTGIFSYVSDTYSIWDVLDIIATDEMKSLIMNRNGKLVIRPDSGDPVKILCGYSKEELEEMIKFSSYETMEEAEKNKYNDFLDNGNFGYISDENVYFKVKNDKLVIITQYEIDGLVESLYNIFGGIVNSKGFKQLDSHIGTIYGDAITFGRAESICEQLKAKGFASTNVVFGVGSFSYQYNTRDTLGYAIKSTFARVNGKDINLFKDPITDDGIKKSALGKVKVCQDKNNNITGYIDSSDESYNEYNNDALELVYENGTLFDSGKPSLNEIRHRITEQLNEIAE